LRGGGGQKWKIVWQILSPIRAPEVGGIRRISFASSFGANKKGKCGNGQGRTTKLMPAAAIVHSLPLSPKIKFSHKPIKVVQLKMGVRNFSSIRKNRSRKSEGDGGML
jgi:hypothetical protein